MQIMRGSAIGRLWLILLLLVLGGCSSALVYNRLDSLAGWYVNALVTLDDSQQAELRGWLDETLLWHRQSELQRYAGFARDLARRAQQPLDRSGYIQLRDESRQFLRDFAGHTAPRATAMLLKLSPAQTQEMLANLEERATKRARKAREEMDDSGWHKRQYDTALKQLRRWTGTATREQQALLKSTVDRLVPSTTLRLDSQRAWRLALRDALLDRDKPQTARIEQLIREPDAHWSRSYVQAIETNQEIYLTLFAALDASLTADQRSHLQRELLKLAAELDALRNR